MHLTDNLWIYVVVVIYFYVMYHLLKGPISNTTTFSPTETMSQRPKIKSIKCRICHNKFKVKSTDFDREIQECLLSDCDLKTRIDEINEVRHLNGIPIITLPANDSVEVFIDDPIVIKVDKHGVETRTVSRVP